MGKGRQTPGRREVRGEGEKALDALAGQRTDTKWCPRCEQDLPWKQYVSRKDGSFHSWCKGCEAEYATKARRDKKASQVGDELLSVLLTHELPAVEERTRPRMQEWLLESLATTRLGLISGLFDPATANEGRKILMSMGEVFGIVSKGGGVQVGVQVNQAPEQQILTELAAVLGGLPEEERAELGAAIEAEVVG